MFNFLLINSRAFLKLFGKLLKYVFLLTVRKCLGRLALLDRVLQGFNTNYLFKKLLGSIALNVKVGYPSLILKSIL